MHDLDAHAADVMARVVEEESAAREHVVVYLSGAHAYGFPSRDSDLDLKAIHIAPTRAMLGLSSPPPTHDRMGFVDGVEIDYTSNELGHAIAGILRGNGNFIERVLGQTIVKDGALRSELAPLVQRSLSRRVAQHYRGFAHNQRAELERTPTVKKLLYVLRTTLTGIHLLGTSELITDVRETAPAHGVPDVERLIERKRAGERSSLPATERDAWQTTIDSLFTRLDEARDRSPLPDEPTNTAELEAWLIETQRARL
jgi:predicted nucleotidyltransferase